MSRRLISAAAFVVAFGLALGAQGSTRPMSPDGSSSAQVLGQWTQGARPSFTLGRGSYQNGQWIDISYGRPLKRGRDLWGSGPNYGKDALVDTSIWRAGANVSTQLKNAVPIVLGGKTIPAGTYTIFIDLKENNWTLVVSSWAAQAKYDPNDKSALWGSYSYTPDKDLVRTPMKLETLPHSFEQLSWQFLDMTPNSGTLALVWDKVLASVPFKTAG